MREVTRADIRKHKRQIEAWYPYEPKPLPTRVQAGSFFVTDPHTVKLVEQHLIPSMPAALFFSGSYRVEPRGPNAYETIIRDFERVIRAAGHEGRYFAVAAKNEREGRRHIHAIVDYGPHIPALGNLWADAHGMWRAGLADPGAFYYVGRHAHPNRIESVVLDRTMLDAFTGKTAGATRIK
ncbi:MAG: hypothetical protein WBI63_09250 [Coriobacteriia bacterium]